MREKILRFLYRCSPFDLTGDCVVPPAADNIRISCVINFYGRLDLLRGILYSLSSQHYPKDLFEVVLVEDRGGTVEGRALAGEFAHCLEIRYVPLPEPHGLMGHSRNFGLARSRGEIVLFLDDDTVILQENFLEVLARKCKENPDISAVVPHGLASFAVRSDRYDFHDDYFMTSRCTAYRRQALAELGGFISEFVGQEDVEFVVRFSLAAKKALKASDLEYYHPPLLVPNFRKPKAVGHSFFLLRKRGYAFIPWLLLLLNCGRHAPLYLVPLRRCREMGRFGIGFIAGVIASFFKKEGFRYS